MKNILILLALTVGLYAQDGAVREAMTKKMEQGKEQREAWVIGALTEHLDLNTDQAQKFFPLQNEFHNKADGAKKVHQEKLRELRLAAKDDRSKFDVDAAIDSKMRMKGTLVRLESKFLKETEGILSKEQRAKLLFFEERMKANIAKEMKGTKDFDRGNRESKRFFDRNRRK
jgi:Spy/CpxP family protein refolding chaperone